MCWTDRSVKAGAPDRSEKGGRPQPLDNRVPQDDNRATMGPALKRHHREKKHLPPIDPSMIMIAKHWVEGYLFNQPGATIEWLDSPPEMLRFSVNGCQAVLDRQAMASIGATDDSGRKRIAGMLDALIRR